MASRNMTSESIIIHNFYVASAELCPESDYTFLWCVVRGGCIGNRLPVYIFSDLTCVFVSFREFRGVLNCVSIRRNECHFLIAPRVICPIYIWLHHHHPFSFGVRNLVVSLSWGLPQPHKTFFVPSMSPQQPQSKQSVALCPFREADPYV